MWGLVISYIHQQGPHTLHLLIIGFMTVHYTIFSSKSANPLEKILGLVSSYIHQQDPFTSVDYRFHPSKLIYHFSSMGAQPLEQILGRVIRGLCNDLYMISTSSWIVFSLALTEWWSGPPTRGTALVSRAADLRYQTYSCMCTWFQANTWWF